MGLHSSPGSRIFPSAMCCCWQILGGPKHSLFAGSPIFQSAMRWRPVDLRQYKVIFLLFTRQTKRTFLPLLFLLPTPLGFDSHPPFQFVRCSCMRQRYSRVGRQFVGFSVCIECER